MAKLSRRGYLTACGGSILGGCSAVVNPPTARGSRRSGAVQSSERASEEGPAVDGPHGAPSGIETRWKTYIPGQFTLVAPAVSAEALYIGSDREVRRLALADGTVQWEAPMHALTHKFTPVRRGGVVYAAGRDMVGSTLLDSDTGGSVAALSADDGSERWRAPARVTAGPTLAEGTVLVPTTAGGEASLRALSSADGAERWRARLGPGEALAAATVTGDSAVVPVTREDGGTIVAIALTDGSERWALETEPVEAPASVAQGTAYVPTTEGTVHALRLDDGTERWRRSLDDGIYTRPSVINDILYLGIGDVVYALSAGTGRERWRGEVGHVSRTGITGVDGRVYVGGVRVTALDADEGSLVWSHELVDASGTFGQPVVQDGVLYTGACVKGVANDLYDHYVYAITETPA